MGMTMAVWPSESRGSFSTRYPAAPVAVRQTRAGPLSMDRKVNDAARAQPPAFAWRERS
jgi:hypothetical protein